MRETASYVEDVLQAQAEYAKANHAYEVVHAEMVEARDKMSKASQAMRAAVRVLGDLFPAARVVVYEGKAYYFSPTSSDPIFSEAEVVKV